MTCVTLAFQFRRKQIVFSLFFHESGGALLCFQFSHLTLRFFPCLLFLLLFGLLFSPQKGILFCKIIAERDPMSAIENFMKQTNLICGEFRFNERHRVWTFLFAAPAN